MITYYRAIQRGLEDRVDVLGFSVQREKDLHLEAELFFQAQEWKVDRRDPAEGDANARLILEARWTFAVWAKRVWTVTAESEPDPSMPVLPVSMQGGDDHGVCGSAAADRGRSELRD